MRLSKEQQYLPENPTKYEMSSADYDAMKTRYSLLLQEPSNAISNNIDKYNKAEFLKTIGTVGGVVLGSGGGLVAPLIFFSALSPLAFLGVIGTTAVGGIVGLYTGFMGADYIEKTILSLRQSKQKEVFESTYHELRQQNFTLKNNKDFSLLYDVMGEHLDSFLKIGCYDVVRDFVEYTIIKSGRMDRSEIAIAIISSKSGNFKSATPILDDLLNATLEQAQKDGANLNLARVNFAHLVLKNIGFNTCSDYIDKILKPVDLSKDNLLSIVMEGVDDRKETIKQHLIKHHYVAKTATLSEITNPNRLARASATSPEMDITQKTVPTITQDHIDQARQNLQSYNSVLAEVQSAVHSGRVAPMESIGLTTFENVTRVISEANDNGLKTLFSSMAAMRDLIESTKQGQNQIKEVRILLSEGMIGNIQRTFHNLTNRNNDGSDIVELTRIDARISSTIRGSIKFIEQLELLRDYGHLMDEPLANLSTAIDTVRQTLDSETQAEIDTKLSRKSYYATLLSSQLNAFRQATTGSINTESDLIDTMRRMSIKNVIDGIARGLEASKQKGKISERMRQELLRDGMDQLSQLRSQYDSVLQIAESHLEALETSAKAFRSAANNTTDAQPLALPAPSNDAVAIEIDVSPLRNRDYT